MLCADTVFAQAITLKVMSYLISKKQNAALYEKAELSTDDETQAWELVLYRKDGSASERIRLENFAEVSGNGVFRKVSIQEGEKTSGQGMFGYVPVFDSKIQIDLCDNRTEAVRRRLILGLE
jgi:uncharacterized glyoxalase superfamily metalloenzyme YdcJ